MYWWLVSRGVVSGLCLVAAKYWYDTKAKKAVYNNGLSKSASGHTGHPEELAVAVELRAMPSATSAAANPGSVDRIGIRTRATIAARFASLRPPVWLDYAKGYLRRGRISPERLDTRRLALTDMRTSRAGTSQGRDIPSAAVPFGVMVDDRSPDLQSRIGTVVVEPPRGRAQAGIDDDQRVGEALASGDLPTMDTLLDDICDPVLRNLLLKRLVTGYYRLRLDSKHRAAFYRVASLQIEEASSILEGIKEIGRPRPNQLEAFKAMAIALEEDGRQAMAIEVCELALSLGLHDGTKTGFKGRIRRMKRRQARSDEAGSERMIH